jgi:hypothetical protein
MRLRHAVDQEDPPNRTFTQVAIESSERVIEKESNKEPNKVSRKDRGRYLGLQTVHSLMETAMMNKIGDNLLIHKEEAAAQGVYDSAPEHVVNERLIGEEINK